MLKAKSSNSGRLCIHTLETDWADWLNRERSESTAGIRPYISSIHDEGEPHEESHPALIGLRLTLTTVVSLFGMAICVEPGQETADAAVGQGDARICGTVIEIDRVAVCSNGIATGKYDVLNISPALVVRFGGEHPGISTDKTLLRLFQIK